MPFSSLSQTFLFKGLTYAGLLLACLLIFRWLSEAASAWFEVVLHRRSPWPILLLTVATALILLAGMYVLVSFFVMFSVVVTPWRQGGPNWIYAYGLFAGGPVLIASMLVWAFPLAARWWRKQSAPGEVAPWVFLDGPPPNIPSRQPVHLGGALLTGAISGLLFCLWIELIYFSRYLPTPVSHGVNSVYGWLLASSTRLFGDESLQLPITAVGLQALAAAIVASRSGPLSAVRGLFAAFVAGFVIAAGDSMFFGFGYEFRPSQLALTALQFMSLGAVVAIPTVIVAAWLKGMTRHVFGNTDNWRKSAHLVASPDATAVFTERKNERRRISWSVVRKGSLAALCVAVAIGITARVREVVVQMHEVKALEASAGRGDSDAQTKLGYMYARGRPVARDDAQAVFWWRKAAEQGNADAQERLAYMYFAGLGIAQDDASALHWIRKAAEQGYAAGEQGLGMMYALGRGIANDDSLAMQWFRKAAEQGNVEAQNSVGNFYALGRGTARDDAAAVEWYRKAAAQGLADAQNNLGVFCALGRGMAQDDVAAVEWFRKAAEHGHADAQNNLGYMYQQGRGLPTDHALALQWFLRAAERGHADAQFNVGQIYEKGEGVAKDDEQAAAWFRKAAEKGHAEAKNRLQAICARGLRAPCAP